MEESDLGHRLREDQIHKELLFQVLKNAYENLSKENKLIYLAGVFDGEGSFGLWKKGNNKTRFEVSVEMKDADAIYRFYNYFGGTVHKCKIRKANWSQTWRWRMQGEKAFAAMEKMVNFLCLRRKEKYYVVKCDKASVERGKQDICQQAKSKDGNVRSSTSTC